MIAPAAAELDRTMEFPEDIFTQLWEMGLVNAHIPEAYGAKPSRARAKKRGWSERERKIVARARARVCVAPGETGKTQKGGSGLHTLDGCIIQEELAWGCSGVSTAVEANTLAQMPVILAGSEALKKKYLGRMSEQPIKCAYGVSEAGAGSDVASIQTRAVKNGDDWVLNGSKMWITNGGVAQTSGEGGWYFVLAVTDPEQSVGRSMTGFVVDADSPGLAIGEKLVNMGQRCSDTRPLFFDDVVVPAHNVLGAKHRDSHTAAFRARVIRGERERERAVLTRPFECRLGGSGLQDRDGRLRQHAAAGRRGRRRRRAPRDRRGQRSRRVLCGARLVPCFVSKNTHLV